jgi:hypothetical protein
MTTFVQHRLVDSAVVKTLFAVVDVANALVVVIRKRSSKVSNVGHVF